MFMVGILSGLMKKWKPIQTPNEIYELMEKSIQEIMKLQTK